MRSSIRTATAVAGFLAVAVIGACSDDILAPPDGTACTVGSIAPGDSVDGQLTASSCSVFSDYNEEWTRAASWTLNARAHTGYVVRVYHREDANAVDNWDGDVFLYARNAAGDAEWAGGWWDDFGAVNTNGGYNIEMIYATAKDQTVSIRVEAATEADTGAYTIVVESCAAPALADSVTSAAVAVDSACKMLSTYGGAGGHVAFWTFAGDSLNTHHLTFTRASGTGAFRPYISGPDNDVACWSDDCTWSNPGATVGPTTLTPTIYMTGVHHAFAMVGADSTATMTLRLENTPVTAPRPPFTGPARAGRNR
jgi:hypothetical protein